MTHIKPIPTNTNSKKEQVEQMFDSISPKYDFLNHFLSLGIDNIWRKKCVNTLREINPKTILDIATGTGDLAIASLKLNPERITGLDLSAGMLKKGKEKMIKRGYQDIIDMVKGDSENLPFEDNSFDASTVGFGVRNFEDLEKGLLEINRVIKKGGKIAILEFSKPSNPIFKGLYNIYFLKILPLFGKLFSSSNSAYTYLPKSVQAFPDGDTFLEKLNKCGFYNTTATPLTFGICTIYTGIK